VSERRIEPKLRDASELESGMPSLALARELSAGADVEPDFWAAMGHRFLGWPGEHEERLGD
jgi:hypothetical protein